MITTTHLTSTDNLNVFKVITSTNEELETVIDWVATRMATLPGSGSMLMGDVHPTQRRWFLFRGDSRPNIVRKENGDYTFEELPPVPNKGPDHLMLYTADSNEALLFKLAWT